MIIDLPLGIKIGRKNYALNLNIYRNTHFLVLNRMKVEFSESLKDKLSTLPSFTKIHLIYTLYPKTRRLCDVANICSIVDKFFCDALVRANKIEDDNYTYIPTIEYKFGSIDKDNPRVTVEIKELDHADFIDPDRN